MKSLKKVFCLVLAMAALICTVGNSVYAEDSITVSSVTFLSDGEPIRFLPGTGDAVSASVTGTGTPTLVLAAFDKDGKLLDAKTNTSGLSVGSVSVTDGTEKIRLFVWNGFSDLTPVTSEEYSLEKGGILQSFSVSGGEVQISGSNIDVTVPVWEADGDALNTYTVKAKTLQNTGNITVGGATFSANTETDIALKSGSVTVREGEKTENYRLNLNYRIYDDFDNNSVFNDITLTASETGKWASSGTATELISSSVAKNYITYGWDGSANTYSDGISIGVKPYTNALKIDKTNSLDKGNSGVSGNALRISKTKSAGGDDMTSPWLRISNSAFQKNSSQVVVEYDMAFDYAHVTQGNIGSLGGGIRYFTNENYALYDGINETSLSVSPYLKIKETGTDWTANGENGKPSLPLDRWYHVKTVLDASAKKATTYVNGNKLAAGNADVSAYWTGDNLISFQTSGFRSMDIWVDNLSVTWNSLPGLESMTVAGKAAQIDNANNTVTVNIPLWDSEGKAVDAKNCPAVLTASEDIKVGDVAVESDTATTLDLSTAQKITVGKKTYDMIVNRTIYDDFDNNSVFNDITLTASETGKWASSGTATELISSSVAKDYITYGWDGSANNYSNGISIGVKPYTAALKIDKNNPLDKGNSGVSGNALRISKTKSAGGDDKTSPWLRISNSAFRENSSQVVVEYDMAFDYAHVTQGNIGSLGGGIRYFTNENYSLYDETNVTSFTTSPYLKIIESGTKKSYDGVYNNPALPLDCWYHVKTVLDASTKKATTYVNGNKLGVGNADVSAYWTGDNLISFQTSGYRSMDIWVDNLSVTYTVGTTK